MRSCISYGASAPTLLLGCSPFGICNAQYAVSALVAIYAMELLTHASVVASLMILARGLPAVYK